MRGAILTVVKNSAIIHLEKVWKIYDMGEVKVHALKKIDLEVKRGEFLVVLGKSGSGKSTMMNVIGCLDVPTKGKLFLDGKNVAEMQESDLAQIRGKKIGFVFQQFNLIPTMSALENVMLPGDFQGVADDELRSNAKRWLRFVDMADRMDHRPPELSGGQMQRVAIARALINNPEIVLADEPTGNLDSKTGENIINLLKQLNRKEKMSVVIVTHDRSVIKYADRVVELQDGEIMKEYKKGGK